MSAKIYLGTQGWSYKDWVGPFYPPGTRAGDYLSRYAEIFDAVELDTTFYAIPRPELVDTWRRSTPDAFRFTAKLPRSITHDRHLVDSSEELAEFLSAMDLLGDKLGAILVQLPPDFTVEERPALEAFLDQLPDGYRFAAEFRHRSWLNEDTYELLTNHGVAWTMLDLHYMPRTDELTADFTYVRWLGDRRKIERMHEVQIDRRPQLDAWAERLDEVARKVQTIFGFANNHYSGHSPSDIRYMRERLGLPSREAPEQGSLL
jgi:uncharacterized protein YecE (DUF72 family)